MVILFAILTPAMKAQNLQILSGNQFSSSTDSQHYSSFEFYNYPRTSVSYTYENPVYTGGHEVTNDGSNSKLISGSVSSTDSADMLFIGNSSGVTQFTVIFDLGVECEVESIDTWILSGLDSQIKKMTYSVSLDGSSYTHLGTKYPPYPTGESVEKITQGTSTPASCRYVRVIVEEKTLDYTGDWSYRVSLGEIVILGTSPESEEPLIPPLGASTILSGNSFSSSEDFQNYGSFEDYSTPRPGVTYTYQDPVYTGGDEVTNDPNNLKLLSGDLASIDPAEMVYLGNTSGITLVSTVFDLGVECDVEAIDTWVLGGAGTQIKKVTSAISSDGVSFSSFGSSIVPYPSTETIIPATHSPSQSKSGRYVKVSIEERPLDYLGNWSYTASLGEVVIIGRAPDPEGPIALLSDNHLHPTGTYNTSMLSINTGATYTWQTSQPFSTDSSLINSDNDDTNDGLGGHADLTDGSDLQTGAPFVSSSSTGFEGQYATVRFDLKEIYDIGEIDVWTIADSTRYMDGYEVQISTNGTDYTSLGYTANPNSRSTNGMANTLTSGITGKNARYVKIILHNANDSTQLVIGEIAVWGTLPYDTSLTVNSTPDQVSVNTRLKNYSKLFLEWTDYNHVVNDVDQYKLYLETTPFTDVSGINPFRTISTGSKAQKAKAASVFPLEPETTYYIAITPVTSSGTERQDVTPLQLTTPPALNTNGTLANLFNINDPAYGAGDYENHSDEWTNMLMKADLLRPIDGIQKNRWFNHDGPVMDQYGRRSISFHLFYNNPSKLSFDNGWGVWSFSSFNEPDLANRDVVATTNTISANHAALKAADSRNLLFEPALGDTNTAGLSWLEDFYNADGQNGALVKTYFDVMDVHAYCKYADPHPTGLLPGVPEALLDKIDTLRALMASHGDSNKPIVFTELGWSTYVGGGSYLRGIDDITQRNYLARAYMLAASKDISAIYWHNFQDNGTNPSNIEHNFGIIEWDGTLKPAYYGYYILSRILSNAVYDSDLSGIANPNYGYRFYDSNEGVYITSIWAADEVTRTANFSTTDPTAKIIGIDGSISHADAQNGSLSLPISGAPIFIYTTNPITVTSIN
tara:strand:+ start:409 stop:3672 length:3264 start_codon:yes stop_codon:yes gene_type:complete